MYHHVQISIHRPFVIGAEKQVSLASLAICNQAARSISRILDARTLKGNASTPADPGAAFMAGTMLLITIWGVKKNRLNVDVSAHIEDVRKCIRALKRSESR